MMTPLFLSGLAVTVGTECLSITKAVQNGWYAGSAAKQDGYDYIVREPKRTPYEMALEVAKQALIEAKLKPEILDGLIYNSIHRHGQPRLWSPASWVQRQLGIPGITPVLSVQQGCNGLLQSIALLHNRVVSEPKVSYLFIGADRFEASGFNRWSSDYGIIYGDAAAGLIFSTKKGFARVIHMVIDGAPELEELHRNAQSESEGSNSWEYEYDIKRSKKRFLTTYGREGFIDPLNSVLTRLKMGLLANPEWLGMVQWVFTPFVGTKIRKNTYEATFSNLGENTGWDIGRNLGHLGTTDGWVGLQYLRNSKQIKRGDRILIVSAGVGFSCGIILLEII